jgi:hypothetical protein
MISFLYFSDFVAYNKRLITKLKHLHIQYSNHFKTISPKTQIFHEIFANFQFEYLNKSASQSHFIRSLNVKKYATQGVERLFKDNLHMEILIKKFCV